VHGWEGEDVAADNLMRELKGRGVEVELRQERKSHSASSSFFRVSGTHTTQHNTALTASLSYLVSLSCVLHYDEICCGGHCCLIMQIIETPFRAASSHLYL
jgi:hypothetical protein